jgi:hypothetical protein
MTTFDKCEPAEFFIECIQKIRDELGQYGEDFDKKHINNIDDTIDELNDNFNELQITQQTKDNFIQSIQQFVTTTINLYDTMGNIIDNKKMINEINIVI